MSDLEVPAGYVAEAHYDDGTASVERGGNTCPAVFIDLEWDSPWTLLDKLGRCACPKGWPKRKHVVFPVVREAKA